MSDAQANKRTAARLFELFSAGDAAGVQDLLADDLVWWIAGKPGNGAVAGTLDKRQVGKLFRNMSAALNGPLTMTVKSAIAENEEVALEVESLGHLKNGRTYNQQYHFRMTIREGKIAAVREYLDTAHVQEVWGAP
jgi:ketosteroid isomerase-like protein